MRYSEALMKPSSDVWMHIFRSSGVQRRADYPNVPVSSDITRGPILIFIKSSFRHRGFSPSGLCHRDSCRAGRGSSSRGVKSFPYVRYRTRPQESKSEMQSFTVVPASAQRKLSGSFVETTKMINATFPCLFFFLIIFIRPYILR